MGSSSAPGKDKIYMQFYTVYKLSRETVNCIKLQIGIYFILPGRCLSRETEREQIEFFFDTDGVFFFNIFGLNMGRSPIQ